MDAIPYYGMMHGDCFYGNENIIFSLFRGAIYFSDTFDSALG